MLIGVSGISALSFISAIGVTLGVCLLASPLGERLGVVAHPDMRRRLHKRATPQVGGIAILLGLIAWLLVTLLTDASADRPLLQALLLCALGVGGVGLADDQTESTPFARVILLVSFIGAAFAINHGFVAHTLNWGSFDPTPIPLAAYLLLMAVTTIGVVNSVNMADGQNGIIGSMFVIWSLCLALVSSGTSAMAAELVGTLSLVFLIFNLSGKLFSGDCGSYGVTFVVGLLVTLAHARGQVSLETVIVWFFIPVADCIRLLISRTIRGGSPFRGDRDHFHHRLEDKLGKQQGLMCYAGVMAASSLVATYEPRFALLCLCLLSAFYFSFAWLTDTSSESQAASDGNRESAKSDNVVSIAPDSRDVRRRQDAL